ALKYLEISDDSFSSSALPGHLQMTFRVFAQRGSGRGAVVDVLGESKDLTALQRSLANAAEDAVRSAVRGAVGAALAEAQQAQAGQGSQSGQGKGNQRGPGGASQQLGTTGATGIGAGPEQITHAISEAEGLEDWPTGGSYDDLPL